MKNYLGLLFVGLFAASTAMADDVEKVKFDLDKSYLAWTGTKVSGSHNGILKLKEATGQVNADESLSGTFVVDMNSLVVSDIEDPDYNKKLKNHLQSPDFFNTAASPSVEFKLIKAVPVADSKAGEPNYSITGELTVKGITKPVSFPAFVQVEDDKVSAKGKATVNRTDFDIKYNSGSFFQNLGDKLIYDDFTVDVYLEGVTE